MNWFAVMTKPRAEELGREQLERQGFECRLPRVRRERRSSEGMRERIEPLFPRYLFLRADPLAQDLSRVRSTRGICGLVRFGTRAASVPDSVISAIAARSDANGLVELAPPQLQRGDRVQIEQGPFAGISAVFEAGSTAQRVRLLISLLGEQCTVVVPLRHLAASF